MQKLTAEFIPEPVDTDTSSTNSNPTVFEHMMLGGRSPRIVLTRAIQDKFAEYTQQHNAIAVAQRELSDNFETIRESGRQVLPARLVEGQRRVTGGATGRRLPQVAERRGPCILPLCPSHAADSDEDHCEESEEKGSQDSTQTC